MMKVYTAEQQDGLEQKILSSVSIAYTSEIKKQESDVNISGFDITVPEKAKASSTDWDLFHFNSILVSTGWNINDDVFLPSEVWNAKSTPVFKKVNYEHDEKDIIGLIIASLAIDHDGKILNDFVDEYDIVVSSALYKEWEDENLQERMNSIIEGIDKGEWFVSMECLFRNFDYALMDQQGNQYVVARSADTAFLTKYLKWFGGPGTYNEFRIGRLLRDFTFSGKGIVRNPANPRSVIFKSKAFSGKSMEISMADNVNELAEAKAEIQKLRTELQSKVEAAQIEEQNKLKEQLETHESTIASLTEERDEVKVTAEELQTKVNELTKANEDLSKSVSDLQAKNEELTKSVATLETEKTTANRISQLIEKGIDKAEAESIVDTWASASDKQFEDVVNLHAAMKEDKKKDEKDKEEEDAKAMKDEKSKASANFEEAEQESSVDLNDEQDVSKANEEVNKACASWIRKSLKLTNKE